MARKKRPQVYLLCLDRPFGHARHYLGYSDHVDERLAHHEAGRGANFLRRVKEAGIGWQLVRTWDGDRQLERRLKNQNHRGRLCPICRPAIRSKERPRERDRKRASKRERMAEHDG